MDVLDWVQVVASTATALNLIVWFDHWRKRPAQRWYAVAALSYLLNVALFMVFRFVRFDPFTLNIWSATIRLQTLITMLGVGVWMRNEHTR